MNITHSHGSRIRTQSPTSAGSLQREHRESTKRENAAHLSRNSNSEFRGLPSRCVLSSLTSSSLSLSSTTTVDEDNPPPDDTVRDHPPATTLTPTSQISVKQIIVLCSLLRHPLLLLVLDKITGAVLAETAQAKKVRVQPLDGDPRGRHRKVAHDRLNEERGGGRQGVNAAAGMGVPEEKGCRCQYSIHVQ